MKRMKKVIAYVLSACLVVTGFTWGDMRAQAAEDPVVTAEAVTADPGDEITVPVTITGNTGMMGFMMNVKYDRSVLTPVKTKIGTLISGTYDDNIDLTSTTQDNYDVLWAGSDNVTGDGEIFVMTFQVADTATPGDYKLALTYSEDDTFDVDYNAVKLQCKDIEVTINGDIPSTDGPVIPPTTSPATASSASPAAPSTTTPSTDKPSAVPVQTPDITKAYAVYADPVSAKAGEEISIPVHISNNSGLMGMMIHIKYDQDVLTPVSTKIGDLISGTYDDNIDATKDNFDILWAGSDNVTGDGILYTLNFEVAADATDGTYGIEMTPVDGECFDESYDEVALNCQEIQVTVSGDTVIDTPEPATPEPATPEPATPEPTTPGPTTPEPATPVPGSPEPFDPDWDEAETIYSWDGLLWINNDNLYACATEDSSTFPSDTSSIWSGSGEDWCGANFTTTVDTSGLKTPYMKIRGCADDATLAALQIGTEKDDNEEWGDPIYYDVNESSFTIFVKMDKKKDAFFGVAPKMNGVYVWYIDLIDIGDRVLVSPKPTPTPTIPTPTKSPGPGQTVSPSPTVPTNTDNPNHTYNPNQNNNGNNMSGVTNTPVPTAPATVAPGNQNGSDDAVVINVVKSTKAGLSSVKSKKKKTMTIKWKKNNYASGYQIQYATSKKFKGKKTVTISSATTTSKTVKKLKSKKTYYVRVRIYYQTSTGKVYSKWSSVKKCKVK